MRDSAPSKADIAARVRACSEAAVDVLLTNDAEIQAMRAVLASNPDAGLLILCARLAEMQEEWQRLWGATSDDWGIDGDPITEAAHVWLRYSNYVWPALRLEGEWRGPSGTVHPDDLLGRLRFIPAHTPEGLRAKAAAILASQDAGCYGADLRNDVFELNDSVLIDVAGSARCLLGEDRN